MASAHADKSDRIAVHISVLVTIASQTCHIQLTLEVNLERYAAAATAILQLHYIKSSELIHWPVTQSLIHWVDACISVFCLCTTHTKTHVHTCRPAASLNRSSLGREDSSETLLCFQEAAHSGITGHKGTFVSMQ